MSQRALERQQHPGQEQQREQERLLDHPEEQYSCADGEGQRVADNAPSPILNTASSTRPTGAARCRSKPNGITTAITITACPNSGTTSLSARPISSDERLERRHQQPLVRAGLDLEEQFDPVDRRPEQRGHHHDRRARTTARCRPARPSPAPHSNGPNRPRKTSGWIIPNSTENGLAQHRAQLADHHDRGVGRTCIGGLGRRRSRVKVVMRSSFGLGGGLASRRLRPVRSRKTSSSVGRCTSTRRRDAVPSSSASSIAGAAGTSAPRRCDLVPSTLDLPRRHLSAARRRRSPRPRSRAEPTRSPALALSRRRCRRR